MILVLNSVFSAALIVLLLWLDRYEKEDIVTLMKIFFMTIILTGVYAVLASQLIVNFSFLNTIIIAPFMEETFKLLVFVAVLLKFNNEINESFDAVVYMGVIALGFAFYENIAYYLAATWQGVKIARLTNDFSLYNSSLFSIFLARLAPGHLLFNIISIYPFGLYLQKKKKASYLIIGWLAAMLLHAGWNFLVHYNYFFCIYLTILLALGIFVVLKLLSISAFKSEPEFGDEALIETPSRYDWSYYLLVYLFVVICGVIAFFVSFLITSMIYSIF